MTDSSLEERLQSFIECEGKSLLVHGSRFMVQGNTGSWFKVNGE